jgi:1-deoxy-D-xylulose-5-phosphate synthase
MSLLDSIASPADVRELPVERLPELATEMRERIMEVVGKVGGHLTSNLGVVELTLALHRVFDFEADRLLWDVGHQCYPHKLVTGRHAQFDSLRQAGGLSGFPSTEESAYDLFNVGHAGTAIATAVGLAKADSVLKSDARTVAVVGDASIVNGVAMEGLNHAGTLRRQFLVVLNDNEWGIAPTQGGVAQYLARLRASKWYDEVKAEAKRILPKLPLLGKPTYEMLNTLKESIKAAVSPGRMFEALGLQYVGPVDGHDVGHLIDILELLKEVNHPVLLHVHTVKGKGCDWAAAEPGKFHSPKPFCIRGGKAVTEGGSGRSWTRAFVDNLVELAEEDERIYALTAGMPDGTGLQSFYERFPERCCDIGIAESCTVDIAAGMAKAGLRPVVAIYSTFLQRAFDQVFQEVSLQGLPVLFCMDRAGLVGGDGPVHHGFLDIAYLRGLPGMVLMAPIDETELRAALKLGLSLDQPAAVRYPRDQVPAPVPDSPPFELGRSRRLREGNAATILAYGTPALAALAAAEMLSAEGVEVGVVSARFAKPIDVEMVAEALDQGHPVITVEDHSVAGGFGSGVLETAQELGRSADRLIRLGLPADCFVPHGKRSAQLAACKLDAAGLASTIREMLELPAPTSQPEVNTSREAKSAPRSTDASNQARV